MINPLEGFSGINLEGTNGVQPPLPTQQPKPKQKLVVKKAEAEPWNSTRYVYAAGNAIMPFDKQPVNQLVKKAADFAGINRELLLRSSFQEGMNKMIADPEGVSPAYENAAKKDITLYQYPVDGFYNYGTDRIGEKGKVPKLQAKGYLPKGFENRMKIYNAFNEKKQLVPTAAFKTNQDALMAKAAMMRESQDMVDEYSAANKIKLPPKERNYFVVAAYNGGWGNGKKMLDEYIASNDKANFIEKGLTSRKGVHKNIQARVSELEKLSSLFK